MRIVLTGGGTGGHIYPALAIGKQISEDDDKTKLLFIGSPAGLEAKIVPARGIPFETVEVSGLRRKLSLENVKVIFQFVTAVWRSRKLLKKFKPNVVIGTGGYVCAPVVFAASYMGIPTLIHEQNADPGLTNQFLSKYVDCVAVSFEQSKKLFPKAKRVIMTGNPCATNVVTASKEEGFASLNISPKRKIVLFVGGSRGAKELNKAMLGMLGQLNRLPNVHFVFVTGEMYYNHIMEDIEKFSRSTDNLTVLPYLNNMPEVLAASTLVVCRSGASTLAEITALGVPSILVPSPNVTKNHQETNALTLVEKGAAEMMIERTLSGPALFERIESLMKDEQKLAQMSVASKSLGMPKSATLIANEVRSIGRRKVIFD